MADENGDVTNLPEDRFCPFVSSTSHRLLKAVAIVRAACEALPGRYPIDVVDVYRNPRLFVSDLSDRAPLYTALTPVPGLAPAKVVMAAV